jgi:hypothetical protein
LDRRDKAGMSAVQVAHLKKRMVKIKINKIYFHFIFKIKLLKKIPTPKNGFRVLGILVG